MINHDDQYRSKRDRLLGSFDPTNKCPFNSVDNCVKPVDNPVDNLWITM